MNALRALPALLVIAAPASAQTMREFSSTRQHRGETRIATTVRYAGGTLRIEPGRTGILYALRLTYDEDRFAPLVRFDPSELAVTLGTEALGRGGIRVGSGSRVAQAAFISLGTRAETDLGLFLSASNARVELGGVRLSRLKVEAGASRADIRFSEANPIRCARADVTAGAGELVISGLGFAQCAEIDVDGGVGKVTLDFTGRWSGRLHLKAGMAMGELVLRLQRQTNIRLALEKFLTSFAPTGLVQSADGRTWSSAGYDATGTRLDIDVETAVGGVTVEWID
jgi:hypothetical protein